MLRATELAHIALHQSVGMGDTVVDATVGNGHDTQFLARLVGPTGRVYGFDIQKDALVETDWRVGAQCHVSLIHAGHEDMDEHLPSGLALAGVMFNLGYLPGSSKDITTSSETTLAGLKQALARLSVKGIVTLVLYPGHPAGGEEAAAVRAFSQSLSKAFCVAHYTCTSARRPAPELVIIERLGSSAQLPVKGAAS